jgi:putative membrane protein
MSTRWAGWLFGAGLVVVAVAIVGLERLSETNFTAHMVQHTLLIVVAAPLLAAGAPAVLDRIPLGWRMRVDSLRGRAWPLWALLAVFVQAVAMILWHVPSAFQAAVDADVLHGLEHMTLLATAVFFWWLVLGAGEERVVMGIVAVFLAALACTVLGAGLTLADHPWYPAYRSLDDQALGGVIMWSIAGLAYFAAAVGLFFTWLAGVERSSPGRVGTPASRSTA